MWKVSCFYKKVHNLANFVGYTAILIWMGKPESVFSPLTVNFTQCMGLKPRRDGC